MTSYSHSIAATYAELFAKPVKQPPKKPLTHSNLIKRIKRVMGDEVEKYKTTYVDSRGRTQPQYNVPLEYLELVLSSATPNVRAKVLAKAHEAINKLTKQTT